MIKTPEEPEFEKERILKEDGRYIICYTFDDEKDGEKEKEAS